MKKMKNKSSTGFTLIELLVVVLIIGILSAVALPQYQVAVMKSRYATIQSNVKTWRDLAEVYYMANGEYPATFSDAGAEISGCWELEGGQVLEGGNVYYQLTSVEMFGVLRDKNNHSLVYTLGFNHGEHSGDIFCQSYQGHEIADKVCKNMGGEYFDTTSFNWSRYKL